MKTAVLVTFLANLIFVQSVFAAEGSGGESGAFEKKIRGLIKSSGVPESSIGIFIQKNGKEFVGINGQKKMIPASLSKIITATGVLAELTPQYKFHTQLFSEGDISDQTLKGNIFLKGGGDPSFVSEKMWFLVNEFYRTGIRKVDGDIIVDDSLFDTVRFDTSRESVRVERAYDAPVGAMSFNWNSATIFIRPADEKGGKAKVWLDPENEYLLLDAQVKTGSKTQLESSKKEDADHETFVVKGTIDINASEQHIYKNISDPGLYSGSNLKSFLAQRGVAVKGRVRMGKVPKNAKSIADCPSEPLSRIVSDMNKFSNNYVAEMLTKNLAVFKGDAPATLAGGVKYLNQFLLSIGFSKDEFEFTNPSGFTRENRFSAAGLVKILGWGKSRFDLFPELAQSFPVGGIDGTLEKRFRGKKGRGWIRAKTGLLDGAVGLAGYAGSKELGESTFAFIFNGSADGARVRQLFDDIASVLAE